MTNLGFKIGSLFSGIGGLELGLEMAGVGETIWQVEREPFCLAVLEKHWPEAKRYTDVCTVGSDLAPVDLICGGFPCQDVSSAGKRAGLAGERSGLWSEFARVVQLHRPAWVVVENVASGAAEWLDPVVRALEKLGYACLPCPISARDVGAPHRRDRVFVVAHFAGLAPGEPAGSAWTEGAAYPERELRKRQPRWRQSGRTIQAEPARDGSSRNVAHTHLARREGAWASTHEGRVRPVRHHGWSSEPGVVPLVYGLSGGLAGRRRRARIRALGNTVVPQCAEVAGWVIRELLVGPEVSP